MTTGPALFVTVDPARGLALLRGDDVAAVLQVFGRLDGAYAEFSPAWSPSARGWVIPLRFVGDVEAWCLTRHRLVVVSERRGEAA